MRINALRANPTRDWVQEQEDETVKTNAQVEQVLDQLMHLADEVADEATEFSDDGQPGEARRHREHALALLSGAALIANAFPETMRSGWIALRLGAVAVDAGDQKTGQALLSRASEIATEEQDEDLTEAVHAEFAEMIL